MRALFKSTRRKPSFAEPTQAPPLELKDAQLAAAFYGQRTGGDLHDYIRVSPGRVLFAMIDVAGRLDQNRTMVRAAQDTFRSCGTQLLASEDVNEAHAMIEICVQMNPAIMKAAGRLCACPVFAGCYNESLGTVCYVNAGHTPGLLRELNASGQDAQEISLTLVGKLYQFMANKSPQNDVTLIALARSAVSGKSFAASSE